MRSLRFSPDVKVEIVHWAQDVAGTVRGDESYSVEYEDLVGAALDRVTGLARMEVDEAVETWGFPAVVNYAGTFVPNYLPE